MSERDFAAELYAACIDDRTPGKSLAERGNAQDRIERILEDADTAGVDLYARFYAIDEQARLDLYPTND